MAQSKLSEEHGIVRERRLILFGKTGNGKSATGNTILGWEKFKSQGGISSSTRQCAFATTQLGDVEIKVMDTPGLSDTKLDDTEIARRILTSLCAVHPGPHAVLLCIRADGRFTKEEYQVFEIMKTIFGEDLAKYTIVIFVGKDKMEKSVDQFYETAEQECPMLWKLLKEIDHRAVFFDNFTTDDQARTEQVNLLLDEVEKVQEINNNVHFVHKKDQEISAIVADLRRLQRSSRRGVQKGPVDAEEQARVTGEDLDELEESGAVSEGRKKFVADKRTPVPPPKPRPTKTEEDVISGGEERQAAGGAVTNEPDSPNTDQAPDKPPRTTVPDRSPERGGQVDEAFKQRLNNLIINNLVNDPDKLSPAQQHAVNQKAKSFGEELRAAFKRFKLKLMECPLM